MIIRWGFSQTAAYIIQIINVLNLGTLTEKEFYVAPSMYMLFMSAVAVTFCTIAIFLLVIQIWY